MFFWVGVLAVAGSCFGMGYIFGTDHQLETKCDIDHEIECLLKYNDKKSFNDEF